MEHVATQSLWRAVHEIGAEKGLEGENLGKLRVWAAECARGRAHAVFDRKKAGDLRRSFRIAIGHAADDLIAGRNPE